MASNPDPEDWYVSCSDDEKYSSSSCPKGKKVWKPKPEDMIRQFQNLEKFGINGFELDWKCLNGRRPKTPESESGEDESDDEEMTGNDRQSRLAVDTSNFDFDANDDNDAPTAATPRRAQNRELKGSARKKTTELSKILSKMERNRLSDAREKAAAASASKSKQ